MKQYSVGRLAVWHHTTSQSPKARVILVHGLSEHSARHMNTIHALTSAGIEVVRFDLRGAGKSGGLRQWVKHFKDYAEDLQSVFHWTELNLPPLPLFILGHSLGGAIAIYYMSIYPYSIRGLIVSAPAYKTGNAISPVKIFFGRILGKIWPTFQMPNSTDYTSISRDPVVQEEYKNDPLSCHFNTLQQGIEILNALEHIPERCSKIKIPVLILHGDADRMVPAEGSREILAALASADKTLEILPGVFHEPHNDLGKEVFFSKVVSWILSRSA